MVALRHQRTQRLIQKYLHINWSKKVDIDIEKMDIHNKKVNIESLKNNKEQVKNE